MLIIGGNEDKEGPREILHRFIQLSGGDEARIVVMTVATRHPEAAAERYQDALARLDVRHWYPCHIRQPDDAASSGVQALLEWATGVFFAGGSQHRLARLLNDTAAYTVLRNRWEQAGLVVAGTSAGAAAMPEWMIVDGLTSSHPRRGLAEVERGLGFVPGVLIESHFTQRGRLGRLMSALVEHPDHIGLGVDENTALLVRGDHFEVIGAGSVTVLDPRALTYTNHSAIHEDETLALCGLTVHSLPAGYGYNLTTRTPIVRREA